MKTFPTLYKKTSTGADQQWTVKVNGNLIISEWGQVGGALQQATDTIKAGKNIGKKNATTPAQQAELEAEALWEKKLKKGYVKSLKDARAGKTDEIIEGGVYPMLAHRYDEHADKIHFPAFAQPKLDGHRCIAIIEDGKCSLWSRTRKPIVSMPHIVADLEDAFAGYTDRVVIDGELYNHEYRDKFEELTSLIRPEYVKPGHDVVQYHVYDTEDGADYSQRSSWLEAHLSNRPTVTLVETLTVEDEDELMLRFDHFLEQGYEGAIVRNTKGPYMNKRSYDLQKVKEFVDGEFEIINVAEGRGKLTGHAIFICKTSDGVEFAAKMKGELYKLQEMFQRKDEYIGRPLTVKYQGITKKNGVPRFPVGIRVREDV